VTRRGTVSRKPAKMQRRPKRSNAPRTARQGASVADLQDKLDTRTRQLNEATERENATAEVLRIISSSPGNLQVVFQTMLANAVRICSAKFGNLWLREGDSFRILETFGAPSAFENFLRRERPVIDVREGSQIPIARAARTKEILNIHDLTTDQSYIDRDSRVVALVELAGAQSLLVVPLLKQKQLLGAIVIYRQEVGPFTKKQIELVKNFAAQAVIAIENARLFNELRESLQQQTATSEVLRVISSSPGAVEPVFEAMLANAVTLALNILLASLLQPSKQSMSLTSQRSQGLLAVGSPISRALALYWFYRCSRRVCSSGLFLSTVRKSAHNFAAQAVIAIENARLLNELRESLQQQTATADVLKVTSRSTFDLQACWSIRPPGCARRRVRTFSAALRRSIP
jgi:GAF domain-containing protein